MDIQLIIYLIFLLGSKISVIIGSAQRPRQILAATDSVAGPQS